MTKKRLGNRIMSLILCVAVLLSTLPMVMSPISARSNASYIADPGTADTWETMMGTDTDGNRYAGRVWADKSVYKNGDTVTLNSKNNSGSSFKVELDKDEDFQVVFSVLGSSMSTTDTKVSSGPMDVVLVLDNSTSMDDIIDGTTRLEKVITASNGLIKNLLDAPDIRLGITSYNSDAETVLPFGKYTNGVNLSVNDYISGGKISAKDDSGRLLGSDSGYNNGTNTQSGIDLGMKMLINAKNTEGRKPIVIVLTDGAANNAVNSSPFDISKGTKYAVFWDDVPTGVALSTLLNAAYNKAAIADNYEKAPVVYGVGVDLVEGDGSMAIINPGDSKEGFNSNNSHGNIRAAYNYYINTWCKGQNVSFSNTVRGQTFRWNFDHTYPSGTTVTEADVKANINYVDYYHNVKSSQLQTAFEQIFEEISSAAFNPISSTTTVDGGTGVKDTPLIYVDDIGKYMEVKNIEAITLFGTSYSVKDNNDGTYSVAAATGTNPTTKETWNTSDHIKISVSDNANGTQRLQVKISQEILPIVLERVTSKTVGNDTTATITEITQNPLRVFYTVGMKSEILLPNGEVDISKIDKNYAYINDTTGEIDFYSNYSGGFNKLDADNNGFIDLGDAHIGFKPSKSNRYYYHQSNQGIFTDVKSKLNSTIQWDASEYGVVWDENKYDLTWMSYNEYKNAQDSKQVYTYVTYYHPTMDTNDAANAAEKVTYLVYTDWKYLKDSIAFYDAKTEKYINYDADSDKYTKDDIGYVMSSDKIADYVAANPTAEIYAVLGVGSMRTSRLHNMQKGKTNNLSETADLSFAPEYTTETAKHNGNDVVIWLGNNGRITTSVDTGIALTKKVNGTIDGVDSYALTITVPDGVVATPIVKDIGGNNVTATVSKYINNVLTVNIKADETLYVSGIPAGTVCQVGEIIDGDYYIESKTDSVTIPTLSQVLGGAEQFVSATVTNAPNEYGNLYITKELTSDHTIPQSIHNEEFEIEVNVGTALKGEKYTLKMSGEADSEVTVDQNGKIKFAIKDAQTAEILRLPSGTNVTITEILGNNQTGKFSTTYRTRNYSGDAADNDNRVVIPDGANATAVIINEYTPKSTTVALDISGKKIFGTESIASMLQGGTFNFKVQEWDKENLKWVDLTGKIASVSYSAGQHGEKTFKIEDVLFGKEYTEAGSWSYQVLEVKGNIENITYDRTLYTFDVTVTDNGGQLVGKVTDNNNTEITDGSYDVQFENTYNTAPVSIDIIKKDIVNNSVVPDLSKAGFKFKAVRTNENWETLTGKDASVIEVYSDAAGEARLTATYTKAGNYYYVITEVDENKAGWNYSKAQYNATVVVTENGGDLTATMSIAAKPGTTKANESASVNQNDKTKGSVSFVNEYAPDDVSVNLDTAVRKSIEGDKTLVKGDYTFKVYKDGTNEEVLSGTNNADGSVTFNKSLNFTKVGKYQYDVKEIKGSLAGITYDETIYDLVVEVTNDFTGGKLVANYYFEDSTSDTVIFKNIYTVTPTEYTISGKKILSGRAMALGEFTFELYDESGRKIQTAKNKINGTFSFDKINYTKAGTYKYTIKEAQGNAPGVIYTGAKAENNIEVIVTVTDNNAVLSASADVKNVDIIFENEYKAAPSNVVFKGTKELVGANLTDGDFTFNLYKTDNTFGIVGLNPIDTKKNTDGQFAFDSITFDKTGTYYYSIIEDADADTIENVVYDSTKYDFVVRVTDNGDGKLRASVQNISAGTSSDYAVSTEISVDYVNASFDEVIEKEVYNKQEPTIMVDGKKVNAGDILTYKIRYTNYTGTDVVVDIADNIPMYTSYVENSASHGGTFAGNRVDWILNVKADETVIVSFDVKVDETEKIVSNTAIVRDGINVYTTNEVVNHTIDNEAKKDVFSPQDTIVSIDGKKVYEGDELLYAVSFTNPSKEKLDIIITDTIPENTTYVDGSADNGGTYGEGKLTWNLEVAPWATVTVKFKVTVNADVGAVTIKNKAVVNDGTNQYDTNEVSNYTVVDEVKKDVFSAEEPTVSIDGKEVNKGDELVYKITYKNTADEKVKVDITDSIPEFTSYVEGSADNDGAYAESKITWNLEVEAKSEISVSFKVKVNEDSDGKTIANEATVLEGKNEYVTNEVTNTVPTPDPELIPDPDPDPNPDPDPDPDPTPDPNPDPEPDSDQDTDTKPDPDSDTDTKPDDDITPESPKTEDNTNISLWLALLFVSGLGLFGTIFGKKKPVAIIKLKSSH